MSEQHSPSSEIHNSATTTNTDPVQAIASLVVHPGRSDLSSRIRP